MTYGTFCKDLDMLQWGILRWCVLAEEEFEEKFNSKRIYFTIFQNRTS